MSGHGFRAMARTILDEVLGFCPDYIQHQLAHPARDPNGRAYNRDAYFWATHQGVEIDVILSRNDRLLGVECKQTNTPRLTPSIRLALEDLGMGCITVIYPGNKRLPLPDNVEAIPLEELGRGHQLF
jgi:predicted AAA+ superfamily ATPase